MSMTVHLIGSTVAIFAVADIVHEMATREKSRGLAEKLTALFAGAAIAVGSAVFEYEKPPTSSIIPPATHGQSGDIMVVPFYPPSSKSPLAISI